MTPKSLLAPARLAGQPVLRSQSDERLVDLVRAGSEPAFEAIVARYRSPLMRYCQRILPEARAEDAVQQTFVSAFAALRRDDAQINLRPWLYRISHNTALNVLRDRGLRHAELEERIDGVERPDQAIERRQGLREVIAAVQALPERQRDAMILRELEGRSYEEIAGELGVSGGAVRQLLNRARNTLRAGVTAVTPATLALRFGDEGVEPTAARVGELMGAGGVGALATKVAATALVTGAVAGGVATVPDERADRGKVSGPPAATAASEAREGGELSTGVTDGDRTRSAGQTEDHLGRRRGGDDSGDSDGDDEAASSSGPGSGDSSGSGSSGSGSGHSGPGSGEATESGSSNSGPGGGGSSGSGSSGSGSGDSGSSGSGSSGSGSSDSGSSGSGSSGSGSSDSGSSGSGSASSGSGSSGSGSSGSGSSGSGSGVTTTTMDSSGPG
jgi:RNA polymerase sigma factor (sigma-70 family)